MSTSRAQRSRPPERTNDSQRQALVFNQALDPIDTVDPALAHQTVSHSRRGGVSCEDPFTYYKAFLTRESPRTAISDRADQPNDGGTWSNFRSDAQPTPGQAEQQQSRPRPVPHSVAVRLTNRSNGMPLATIVERGSVSTLNSYGSLLSVGHLPSISTVENASPRRTSHRPTRSSENNALNRIQEEDQDEHAPCNDTAFDISRTARRDGQSTAGGLVGPHGRETLVPRLPEIDLDTETKGLKGLFRSVLTTLRSSTRSRSRSSSGTSSPMLLMPDQCCDVSQSPQTDKETVVKTVSQRPPYFTSSASTTLLWSTPSSSHHVSENQATNGSSPNVKTEPSADSSTSISYVSPSASESGTVPAMPQLPPVPDLSRLRNGKEVVPSVRSLPPQPRDAALDHVRHAATTALSRSRDELATRYTPEGAFAYRNIQWSLDDLARSTSRNASFCSTMSTSYSGTVLGIDSDLQHGLPYVTRRSVTPVWFSSKEDITDHGSKPRELQFGESKPLHPRSITSSALTSLLPIAAAEGIVQQNLTTPQLTFYSPSGNLIQAQDTTPTPTPASSTRSRLNSYFPAAPATSTSYYNSATMPSAHATLSAAVANPPMRPALIPLTTTAQLIAPLPEHLRHHNHHRVDKSQIGSMCDSESMSPSQVVVTSDSQVLGCGGIIRPVNLEPHRGVPRSPQKQSRIGQSRSCLRIVEANRPTLPSLSLLASRSSCKLRGDTSTQTPRKKGKTLKKRRPHDPDTVPEHGFTAPAAGHKLRFRFRQPYEGVGSQTRETGCRGASPPQPGESRTKSGASPTNPCESSTPHARIAFRGKSNGKGRERRDSVVSVELVRA